MEPINFENTYYIKLGRAGKWEKSSIDEAKLRIGWARQTVDDLNQQNWDIIQEQLFEEQQDKRTVARDINALKRIVNSDSNDIWITFYASHLWWCRVGEQEIFRDGISKYRRVEGEWHNQDIDGNPLIINQIPGKITKIQMFPGVFCNVKEKDILRRLLNNQPSDASRAISKAKEELAREVEEGFKLLHWKDFETLVDLVFHNAGWRRISLLGESMKFVDIELEEPVTGDLYQVQVKSKASLRDFEEYAQKFDQSDFRRLYFVVHTPTGKLSARQPQSGENVELVLPSRLAEMVVDFGLTNWLQKRIR